ncbi:MAG: hypothetical protein AAFX85_09480, partial [Pseudomonadota bacterium]
MSYAPVVVVPLARRNAPVASWQPPGDDAVARAAPSLRTPVQRTRAPTERRRASERTERGVEHFSVSRELDETRLHALTNTTPRSSAVVTTTNEGARRDAKPRRSTTQGR